MSKKGFFIGLNFNPNADKTVITVADKNVKELEISTVNSKENNKEELILLLMSQVREKLEKVLK